MKGQCLLFYDRPFLVTRNQFLEEAYFNWTLSPLYDSKGNVGGLINPLNETTLRVVGEMRLTTLRGNQKKRFASRSNLSLGLNNRSWE